MILKSCNKKLDKQAISDMAKYYNPQSSVYMNMYYWSSMGSKYGYDRCKMAEEVVMDREKLLIKIEQAKEKLDKYEIMLDKITPHKPSVYKHMDWNDKTKQMDKSYEYCC